MLHSNAGRVGGTCVREQTPRILRVSQGRQVWMMSRVMWHFPFFFCGRFGWEVWISLLFFSLLTFLVEYSVLRRGWFDMYDMRDIDHLLYLYRVSMIWIGKKDRKEGEKKEVRWPHAVTTGADGLTWFDLILAYGRTRAEMAARETLYFQVVLLLWSWWGVQGLFLRSAYVHGDFWSKRK